MRSFSLASTFIVLIGALSACLHENPPGQLRGEIERLGPHFIVTECSTHRTYELKLIPAAHVALERRVRAIEEAEGGPVLVELGGKALPATPATAAEALFDVHTQDDVRPGSCP